MLFLTRLLIKYQLKRICNCRLIPCIVVLYLSLRITDFCGCRCLSMSSFPVFYTSIIIVQASRFHHFVNFILPATSVFLFVFLVRISETIRHPINMPDRASCLLLLRVSEYARLFLYPHFVSLPAVIVASR